MSNVTCENCGTINPDNVKFCKQCGNRLPETMVVEPAVVPDSYSFAPPAVGNVVMEKRYGALRGIASFLRILGIILAVLTVLGGVVSFFVSGRDFIIGVGALIVSLISALLTYLLFLVMSEIISVQLDIEENTRRMAFLMEQQLK